MERVKNVINTDTYKKYRSHLQLMSDKHGFIETDKYDSLLFTGLCTVIPGLRINIRAARLADGSWVRRPSDYPSGFPEHTASTISRDMLLGVLYAAYYQRDRGLVDDLIRYAFYHGFVMGKGPLSRTLMSPGLLSTAAWISYRLGGKSRWLLRHLPFVYPKGLTGFQAHLAVLHGLLRRTLRTPDSTSTKAQEFFVDQVSRQPNNPLFLYAAGFQALACAALQTENLWPADRLPTRGDRKEPWLLQRDEGPDWLPCKEDPDVTHSGADYLFVASLILHTA